MAWGTNIGSSIGRNFWGSQDETRDALSSFNWGMNSAKKSLEDKYAEAGTKLTDTMKRARETATQGYTSARANTTAGYAGAKENTTQGYAKARSAYNDNPSVVVSRQELYNRILGKGGYSPETVNSMKGNAIEQAGVQMRDVQNALQDRYGDATSGGMTGENLARALTTVGASRADALRNVDIQNAMLQEQQQSEAMPMAYQDAATMSGLDLGESKDLANLSLGQGKDLSGLDTGEAGVISELLAKEGVGNAGLTTEMAKALAELESNRSSSNLQVGSQKNLLQSLWG